ncbi:MAG: hypothetical protein ORN49_13080 [Rhodobacteraceae bacterium]|nr:hypothetical protein [Paracoccaceae bacterium]
MRFLASLFLVLSFTLPVQARPLTEAEAKGLDHAVASYLRATMSKDAEKVVATIPPRILNVFAGTAGIEAKDVQKTLTAQTKELMKTTAISDFVAAPAPYEGNDATLADATTVVWAVVPTQFVVEANGAKTLNHQPLFAVLEGDKWYFSRIDGPQQQQIVGFAYPFIATAKLPAASSQPQP